MNRLKKYIQNKLYGKYYPVNEDTKDIFLGEHKNYFYLMIKKERLYLLGCIEWQYHECEKYLLSTKTLLGFPKFKNIIRNEEMMLFTTRKTNPLREQVENLDMIKDRLSYEEKNEITLDDINYVYNLKYLRRKKELIKFIIHGCFLIGLIIFFVLLSKKGFIV
jgi:hypothetical protein